MLQSGFSQEKKSLPITAHGTGMGGGEGVVRGEDTHMVVRVQVWGHTL